MPDPTQPDAALQHYADLVRTALGVPASLVTLVSAAGQVFPGAAGLPTPWQEARCTPLSHSFCQHVVARDTPLVLSDARTDPDLVDNLAITDLNVVAYAGYPLHDADGVAVGSLAAIDTAPRTWTEHELAVLAGLAGAASRELILRRQALRTKLANAAERAAAARLAQVTESMAVGYLAMDADWRITYVNTEAVTALGLPREQLVGGVIWELFPATVGTDFEASYRRAAQSGEQVIFEAYYPAPLDAWYEVRATPEAEGVTLYFIDITARHHAQAAMQTAGERLSALGRIALGLSDAEDVEALVTVMAEQGLAALGADGGAVAVPDPDHPQMLRSYVTASYGEQVQADYGLLPLDAALPVCVAATSGRAVQLVDGQASEAFSAEMAAVVAATGCQAWASLPLLAGGELQGVLTAGWAQPQTFDAEQVELLETYAAQCAQALARLAARDGERAARAAEQAASSVVATFSETVQRSLLTSPTTPEDLDIAVRYVPAAAEAYVGGDWYDAFITSAGVTSVVIGDVAGHDRTAAAAMAQLRNLLRGIGYTVSDPPAAVLSTLDRAAAAMGVEAMATCVLAAVEQNPEQRNVGVRTLRWSNAGHPAPLLITADGQVTYLRQEATDLVIGIDPATTRHDHHHDLGPGDVVLLFTDGLIERRGIGLDVGMGWLREAVTAWAGLQLAMGAPLEPEALCDVLLAQVEGYSEDDVALLALRATPQAPLANP